MPGRTGTKSEETGRETREGRSEGRWLHTTVQQNLRAEITRCLDGLQTGTERGQILADADNPPKQAARLTYLTRRAMRYSMIQAFTTNAI